MFPISIFQRKSLTLPCHLRYQNVSVKIQRGFKCLSWLIICGGVSCEQNTTMKGRLAFLHLFLKLLPPEDKENHRIVEYLLNIDMLNRYSMDRHIVNKHGRQLLGFCKATVILILNGRLSRVQGIGCFTGDGMTGRSVVDYAISSLALFEIIDYFEVLHKFPESDHRPVSLSLTCSPSTTRESGLNYDHDWHLCNKYTWSQDGLNDLVFVISDNESEIVPNSLLQCTN